MRYIVAKLDPHPDADNLYVTDTATSSTDLVTATNRLGTWKGDLFAVWEWRENRTPNAAEIASMIRIKAPKTVWVHGAADRLYKLDDEHTERIAPPWALENR